MRSGASGSAQHSFGAFLCDVLSADAAHTIVHVLATSEKHYTYADFRAPSEKRYTASSFLDPLVTYHIATSLLDPSEKQHTVAELRGSWPYTGGEWLRVSALTAPLSVSFASP